MWYLNQVLSSPAQLQPPSTYFDITSNPASMPFYSIATPLRDPYQYYVITTPDRETADLFYRYIQERPSDIDQSPKIWNLCRLSTQMWKFSISPNCSLQDVVAEITKPRLERFADLVGSVIIERHFTIREPGESAGVPVIPHIDTADMPVVVSEGEYLIRNKFDHSQYWGMVVCPGQVDGMAIRGDRPRTQATAFRIELADKDIKIDGQPLLIASDEVFITAVGKGEKENHPIYYDTDGRLSTQVTPGSSGSFKFGHLRQGNFTPHRIPSGSYMHMHYSPTYCGVAREAWELVL